MLKQIYIYGNPTQNESLEHLARFFCALADNAHHTKLLVEPEYFEFILTNLPEIAKRLTPIDNNEIEDQKSLALSIGGDGTFLTTANRIFPKQTPIMGINAGHLGYLAAADIALAPEAASSIIAGDYRVEPRTMLEVKTNSEQLPSKPFALNEVAILKQDTASMINVMAEVNGHHLATYSGDGLIIATPTGSTGYNLSVGGPIVAPHSADWVISPIAPHSLSMRPLVVNDSVTLRITATSRSGCMLLAIDGRSTPLPITTELTISKASVKLNVALLNSNNFIDTLQQKLHWG